MASATEQTAPAGTTRERIGSGLMALAVLAAIVVLVVSVILLLRGFGVLGSWSEIYGSSALFVIDECATSEGRLANRAECAGSLFLEDGDGISSTLTGPKASFGSSMPPAGGEVAAYYRAGDLTQSFPLEARPTELARVIVGLVPLFFVIGGVGCWLVGWALTRNTKIERDQLDPYRESWPARYTLRSRGVTWAVVGLAWLGLDRFLIGDLLGTAGLG